MSPQKVKVEAMYRKRFFCPVKDRVVKVDFLAYRGEPKKLLGVVHCSAFPEGQEMDCDQSCIYRAQAQIAPPLFNRPLPLLA